MHGLQITDNLLRTLSSYCEELGLTVASRNGFILHSERQIASRNSKRTTEQFAGRDLDEELRCVTLSLVGILQRKSQEVAKELYQILRAHGAEL